MRALGLGLSSLLLLAGEASADVVLDGTAGPAGALSGPDFAIEAELGRRAGDNLFHSFARFGLEAGESATFSGPDAIRNVIGRVTGGERSDIDGALRSEIPGAALWFFNPAGVAFGPNATLDLQGSFHVSTADELRFADGATFSATDPDASAFTVAEPEAFGFLGTSRAPMALDGAVLAVPTGATFAVSAGDISLANGAQIVAVTRGSEDAGVVRIESNGTLSIDGSFAGLFANSLAFSENSGDAGSVEVDVDRLEMSNGAAIQAVTQGGGSAGLIDIEAGEVSQAGRSHVQAWTTGSGDAGHIMIEAARVEMSEGSRTQVFTQGSGDAGDVEIVADTVLLDSGGQMSASGFSGPGDAGRVDVTARDLLRISGEDANGFPSGLFVTTGSFSSGDGGVVLVRAADLLMTDQGRIQARSSGSGSAGLVDIDAGEVTMDGATFINADARAGNAGPSGRVDLRAERIVLENGAQIGASVDALTPTEEPSGAILIRASESLEIRGFSTEVLGPDGRPLRSGLFNDARGNADSGEISITTPLFILDGGRVTSDATAELTGDISQTGDAGDIALDVERLVIRNEGQIFAGTDTAGDGGTITVAAGEISIDGARALDGATGIFSNVKRNGSGDGGRIVIEAGDLRVANGGQISTRTLGAGPGGTVDITLADGLLVDGSVIETAVETPASPGLPADDDTIAGDLTVAARTIALADGARISSRSERGPGDAGTIALYAPDSLELRAGTVTSRSVEGGGGRVVIQVGRLIDLEDSAVETSVFGGDDTEAGDIVIDPDFLVLDDSTILARAIEGRGGNIDITAGQLILSPESSIDASAERGIDGTVTISSPDTDLAGELVVLEGALVDAGSLLRERCAARGDAEASSFTGVGRGGLPPAPDGPLLADYARDIDAGQRSIGVAGLQPAGALGPLAPCASDGF